MIQSYRTILTFMVLQSCFLTQLFAQSSGAIEVSDCVVRFAEAVDVPALQSGRVAEVMVKLNQPIERNAAIARLDDRTLMIRRRASALRLEHGRDRANDDVELRYAETALAEANAELDASRSIHKDVSGAIPMTHLRRLRLAVERGELEVAQAKKRQKDAQVEVELREADLAMLDDELNNVVIRSPLSGTVLEVTHCTGEWIEKGQAIATVARIDRLHVHALVREDQIPSNRCKDLPVSVHWIDSRSAAEKSLRGQVLSADPQMLPGGKYRLHAEILNRAEGDDKTSWELKPGMAIKMKIHQAGLATR